jgi:uncharacterized protein involved in outer membrane biogenesis
LLARDEFRHDNIPMRIAFRIILVVILVGIVVGIIVAATSLDGIVKEGAETFGPQITKVSVKLDSVHIVLFTGSARVSGLVVGNPEGYKAPQAISVGLAEIGVNPFSILSDKIVIRSFHIVSPEITFEGGLHGNNLSTILDNVDTSSKPGAKPSTNSPAPAAAGKSSMKFEVDDFVISGAKAHVRLTDLGGKEMTLSLPDIHLTDLGTNSDGITAADLTHVVLKAVTTATVKAVSAAAGDLGKGLETLGKDAAGGATTDIDEVKKKLGGLFHK